MNTGAIWSARRLAFWKEAAQFWSYVGRSGFAAFASFAFIAGSYYYIKSLSKLPANFPYWWILVAVMLPVLAASPIRTFIRSADLVYLLPAESQMNDYFRKSFRYSLAFQCFYIFVACTAVWPLYLHGAGGKAEPFVLVIALLLLDKAANLSASWQERRLVNKMQRGLSSAVRWLLSATAVYALFRFGILYAAIVSLGTFLLHALLLYQLPKHRIPWLQLAEEERARLSRHYLFFSWFTDVPQLATGIKKRAILTRIARRLPFRKDTVFLYLYALTLLRTEVYTIAFRLTLAGIVLLALFPGRVAAAIVFGLVLLMSGIQMAALERYHRYSFWPAVYPVSEEGRPGALCRIIFAVLAVQSVIFTLTMLVVGLPPLFALSAGSLALCLSFFYCFVPLQRSFRRRSLEL
jgi:ABC-2 type transport system permease protein